jgi:hypothetical protein
MKTELIRQTVYIKKNSPNNEKNQVLISEWDTDKSDYCFFSFATKKEVHYALSEEQLISLLRDAFNAGKSKEEAWNKYQSRRDDYYESTWKNTPTKDQYIDLLFSDSK